MTGTVETELEQFTRGDIQAFETLFREYQGEVYGWIVRIVRDPGVAEDLTVETFWRIYRARARFDPHRPFGAWARRIATNLALEHLSRRRGEEPLGQDLPPRGAPSAAPDAAVDADVRAKVLAAFGELPAKLRAAATLAMIEETPYAEIAEALGISVNGVKSRVFRAVRLLRRSLEKRGVRP
ncbi:MAG TPA: RNA polymerase sigma factor [Bryobacteraceae bacterium]|nr:RNA polymerase sigma factor [Bryobacteraceae bacterium]